MTGAELKTLTESLIDDTIDSTLFYQLLNVARINLEEKKDWEYLKAYDGSNTVTSANTFTTMKSLPTRFRNMCKVYVGDDSEDEYVGVPFEERRLYQDFQGRYYIDYANSQFAIIGDFSETNTIHLFYTAYGVDVESATSPVFPTRFHPLLAFMVAGYYTAGVDADDIYARMSPAHRIAARELENSMNLWDNRLKMNAIQNSSVMSN